MVYTNLISEYKLLPNMPLPYTHILIFANSAMPSPLAKCKMKAKLLRAQISCRRLLYVLIFVVGCFAALTVYSTRPAVWAPSTLFRGQSRTAGYRPLLLKTEYQLKDPIFAGVLLQRKYLNTIGKTINKTWASEREINAFSLFISGENHSSNEALDLPVTTLRNVPEFTSYKSSLIQTFEVLKYLCFHHADRYSWFLLTYNDTYIVSRELLNIVKRMNPDSLVYFGKLEYEHKMDRSDYFCSGHAGVLLSNKALRAVVPFLDQCLHSIAQLHFEPANRGSGRYTERGDAGIGYCMKQALGVTCSASEEVS